MKQLFVESTKRLFALVIVAERDFNQPLVESHKKMEILDISCSLSVYFGISFCLIKIYEAV